MWIGELNLNAFLTAVVRARLGHMWESQVMLTDGQVVSPPPTPPGSPVFVHLWWTRALTRRERDRGKTSWRCSLVEEMVFVKRLGTHLRHRSLTLDNFYGYVQTPDQTGSGSITGSDPVFCAMVIFSSIFYSLCTVGRGLQHTKLFLPHTFIPI